MNKNNYNLLVDIEKIVLVGDYLMAGKCPKPLNSYKLISRGFIFVFRITHKLSFNK